MEQSRINQSIRLDSATAHTILDSALDAHILMSQTGTIVAWNPQSERIFGWTAQEVLGRCLSEVIIPPAFREAHERAIRTFDSTGQGTVLGKRIEVDGWHRDQRQFFYRIDSHFGENTVRPSLQRVRAGHMERKQAEKFLKEAKERAEQAARDRAAILAAVDVFFIYVDCHGLVTEWTARAEQTFGLFRAIVLGRRLPDLPIPWNWDEVVGMMQGGGDRKKVRLRQGDGTNGSSGRRSPLSSRGRAGWIFMGKDITEQVKLEHDIAQSQKLESIGQLAAGIAHEINTPTQFVGDNTMFLNESFIDVLHVLRQSGSACRRAGRRLFAGSHRCLHGCQRAGRLYLSAVRDSSGYLSIARRHRSGGEHCAGDERIRSSWHARKNRRQSE